MKELTVTEAYIWKYLNANYQEVVTKSISELGELINVSNASITRTLKKKGYDGFSDFKYALSQNHNNTLTILNTENLNQETRVSILKSYQEVTKTLNNIDLNTLDIAVKQLKIAQRIFIFACGFSQLLGEEMKIKLQLLNKYCELHSDPNIIRPISKRLKSTDFVIFISLNGETNALKDAAINCKQLNINHLLITANASSSLCQLTNLQLKAFKTELTYFPDVEVHSRLPLYIIGRLLLDNYAAFIQK